MKLLTHFSNLPGASHSSEHGLLLHSLLLNLQPIFQLIYFRELRSVARHRRIIRMRKKIKFHFQCSWQLKQTQEEKKNVKK